MQTIQEYNDAVVSSICRVKALRTLVVKHLAVLTGIPERDLYDEVENETLRELALLKAHILPEPNQ